MSEQRNLIEWLEQNNIPPEIYSLLIHSGFNDKKTFMLITLEFEIFLFIYLFFNFHESYFLFIFFPSDLNEIGIKGIGWKKKILHLISQSNTPPSSISSGPVTISPLLSSPTTPIVDITGPTPITPELSPNQPVTKKRSPPHCKSCHAIKSSSHICTGEMKCISFEKCKYLAGLILYIY